MGTTAAYLYTKIKKFLPFYEQLTQADVSMQKDLQPTAQKKHIM